MTEHKLKTWPQYFDAVERGEKTFEVRRNDRGFQKGDIVVLQRTKDSDWFTLAADCKELRFRIGYVLTGGEFGVEPGYCVLSLLPVEGE